MSTHICAMKRIALITALMIAPPAYGDEGGPDLMGRGVELLLEGLRQEMGPALEELRGLADSIGPALQDFVAEMGPALRQLLDEVEDWSAYHPPEMLENGDIIIRRKPDTPSPPLQDDIEI